MGLVLGKYRCNLLGKTALGITVATAAASRLLCASMWCNKLPGVVLLVGRISTASLLLGCIPAVASLSQHAFKAHGCPTLVLWLLLSALYRSTEVCCDPPRSLSTT